VAWAGIGLTRKLPVVPSNLEEGYWSSRYWRGRGDGGWCSLPGSCRARGVWGRSHSARVRVQGAGIVIVNASASAVDNGLLVGGACWGAENRREQWLRRGLCVMGKAFLCRLKGETGEGPWGLVVLWP